MRVLITGGAGFIGSHIAEYFNGQAEIIVLDNLRTGKRKNIEGVKHEFIEASILDRAAVREAMRGVDYVFHLAAMVSVPESMEKPVECVRNNVEGALNILEEAAEAKVKKLCFSSSSAVYGENPESPKTEDMTPDPRSPYAISKLDGEYYCGIFTRTGRLQTTCLRYFNVFGPRQDPKSAYAAAIPIFVSKAVSGENIPVFGDGEQTRDFVYVKDVVAANVFFAQNSFSGIFNVGCGKSITVNSLAKMIIAETGSKSEIAYLPERPGDIKHSLASIDKLLSTGFVPSCEFRKGLAETLQYFNPGRRQSPAG